MIEVSDQTMALKGYGGDYRKQKAHVRIKGSGWGGSNNYVGGASNDLGFEQLEDGSFAFHVSDYDKRRYGGDWQKKLLQQYGREVIKEIATENNFFISNEHEENGEIFIEVHSQF